MKEEFMQEDCDLQGKCKLYGIPYQDREKEDLIASLAYIHLEISHKKMKIQQPEEPVQEEDDDNLMELIPKGQAKVTQLKDSDIDGESLSDSDLDGEPIDGEEI